ncbi:MAG: 4-alpha-glucanotransferase [Anaerolineales bacterium]
MERRGGILLHPTSLPGPGGIGDLGAPAHRWIDWLASSGCRRWQVLPLGPTGYGDSPYQSPSSHAGNPLLISLEALLDDGMLKEADLAGRPAFPNGRVDYASVIDYKDGLLTRASERFTRGEVPRWEEEYQGYIRAEAGWLDDYALFAAMKRRHQGAAWTNWEPALARRQAAALRRAEREAEADIQTEKVRQFIFERQWARLRKVCAAKGVAIVGDLPIFVAHDSVDVWVHPELFFLDSEGSPTVVAGVPPDFFTPEGQRWGNPLYRWSVMRKDGFAWWIDRLRATLRRVDEVRLDHFLGFHAYWEIQADAPTAVVGRWVPGPSAELLEAIRSAVGSLPIIAEDLGVVTRGVIELRDRFELPGMKILQFAFTGGADNEFLPHHYPRRCVVYTGTHDNDTSVGWYENAPEVERDACRRYLGVDGHDIAWDLIRSAWASAADLAMAPLQDVLSLGSESRMNLPGRPDGNWTWRFLPDQLTEELAARLEDLNSHCGRI